MPKLAISSVAACLSGVLLFLSHPSSSLWFVAWIALVPLLLIVHDLKKRGTSFFFGWLTGLFFYVFSISWIENVISEYSALPWPLPLLGMLLLAAYMALYPAMFALLVHYAHQKNTKFDLIWLATGWVVLEWLQSLLLTGFPWNLLGYSQLPFLPAIQVADLGGVYLVSFVVISVNLLIVRLIRERNHLKATLLQPGVLVLTTIVLFSFVYGLFQLGISYDSDDHFTATVIQDDLDNMGRWESRRRDPLALYRYYEAQAVAAVKAGSDVVLWGEGAFMYLDMMRENGGPPWRVSDFEELSIFSLVKDNGFWLVMGSNDYLNDGLVAFNTAVTISPDHQGSVSGRYAKVHLTPFGEYIPFQWILGWLDKIVPEISDFATGVEPNPMPLLDGLVGVPICYEVIFPDLVRQFVNKGAGVLATISNDAWFGRSAANQQHFNMAAFRSVENRRYLIRCAVSGISGFSDPHGRILQQSKPYMRESLTQEVAMLSGQTVYSSLGDIFVLVSMLVVLLFFIRIR